MEIDKIMEFSRKNWEEQLALGRQIDKHIAAVVHGRNFGKTKWMQEQLRKAIKNEFERLPDGTICYLQCGCCLRTLHDYESAIFMPQEVP